MRFEKPVLLYGAGREALSTRAFLKTHHPDLEVYITADSDTTDIAQTRWIAPEDLPFAISAHRFGLIVKSPGVSLYKPVFGIAHNAGLPVSSNLNLWGYTYRNGRFVIAITGTKGKSTTATLTHLMLTHSGIDAGLAGNVGIAPLAIADQHKIVIFELSSYQTADMDFLPDIAALTNLYPEHVDWHGSVERYYADKLHLINREGGFSVALGAAAKRHPLVHHILRDKKSLIRDLSDTEHTAISIAVTKSRLKGDHNIDNAHLAARIALTAGGTLTGILAGIAAFHPLPHRLEEHRIGNLLFVNDSISTTPEATRAALAAYPGARLALIAGGHERKQDYTELARNLAAYGVTMLACLPVTGQRLADAARTSAPTTITILNEPNLASAMQTLHRHRDAFDIVILSPGAPSYNQFNNFEERGHHFIKLAENLFTS